MEIKRVNIFEKNKTSKEAYEEVLDLYNKYNFFNKGSKGILLRLQHNWATVFLYEEEVAAAMMVVYNGFRDVMEFDIIVKEEYRGREYAAELLTFSETLNISTDVSHQTLENNVAMRRVFEKCGYEVENKDGNVLEYKKKTKAKVLTKAKKDY